jgi:hypothetical protein
LEATNGDGSSGRRDGARLEKPSNIKISTKPQDTRSTDTRTFSFGDLSIRHATEAARGAKSSTTPVAATSSSYESATVSPKINGSDNNLPMSVPPSLSGADSVLSNRRENLFPLHARFRGGRSSTRDASEQLLNCLKVPLRFHIHCIHCPSDIGIPTNIPRQPVQQNRIRQVAKLSRTGN